MPTLSQTKKPKFRVGDKVAFTFGTRRVKGVIVEDRGPLGVGGRRIYGVRLDMDPYDPMFFELPEEELELSQEPERPLTKDEVRQYLADGGLLLMMHGDLNGSLPRVWLRRDNLGNVTHTFVEERGMVGGAAPPAEAIVHGRIRAGSRERVAEFITSFGLSERDADAVIDAIGTKP